MECPGSSPITDCPGSFGAWFRVAIETYACTPDALRKLSKPPPETPQTLNLETLNELSKALAARPKLSRLSRFRMRVAL
jgi:hypothetical protein